jgi:hypothetical protein
MIEMVHAAATDGAALIEGVPLTALGNGVGVVGIVLIIGWMLASGRLFTRRQYDDLMHDRDEWRAAHRISEQARLEERDNNKELVAGFGATLTGFLGGFRRASEEAISEKRGESGGPE